MGLFLQPLHETGAFPPPMLGTRSLGSLGNRLGGDAVVAAVDHVFTQGARTLSADHGLPASQLSSARRAREGQGRPVWHGFSFLVAPRPCDWRPGLEVSGYWWPHDTATTSLRTWRISSAPAPPRSTWASQVPPRPIPGV
ncbi:hypothetical protein ACFTWH_09005 [Streptomyces sp. NPDC057011]|uniref:hypothetical protein n=1 Tax=unclassified Streptomyces TaxID=2593676 RepID=UPI003639DD72